MKICQINIVYSVGSTGKIVKSIHENLQKSGHDSYVIYGAGKSIPQEKIFSVSTFLQSKMSALYRRITGKTFEGAFFQTNRVLKILKRIEPDVVHIHCINGNNFNICRILDYLAKSKVKTILTMHAEFMYTGGCGHAYQCERWKSGCGKCPTLKEATGSYFFDRTARNYRRFAQSYARFEKDKLIVIAVSDWLKHRVKESPLLNRFRVETVLNPIDTDVFRYYNDTDEVRKKCGTDNKSVIFFATAHFSPFKDENKGGKFILDIAEKLKDKNVKIVVAALKSDIDGKLPENVLFYGAVKNQEELARLYSFADVTLITSKKETFSMPTAESLCCGTQVAGFFAGGPESMAIEEYSAFSEYGDVSRLCQNIMRIIKYPKPKEEVERMGREKYSSDVIMGHWNRIYTLSE